MVRIGGWKALWRKGTLGGDLLRRQVPAVLFAPPLLWALAYAGERAHLFPEALTLGVVVSLSAVAGLMHTFWTAASLDSLERARTTAVRDLQASEAMFRGLMEGASDAILVTDEAGRIAFKNRQAATLFGYEHSELLGQNLDRLIPERYRSAHAGHLAAYMRAPARLDLDRGADLYGLRKDGQEFPAEISLSPVETVEGRHVMVLVRDLTERRRAAADIAALNARLQRRNEAIEAEIAARTRELARVQAERVAALERADALKDEFLNIVSHELRTPISVLSGTISLFEVELDGPLSDAQRRDVRRLRESTDHLLMLVTDLLDMSMIHAGKLTLVPKRLHPGELMAAAIDFVQPLATERHITVRTEVPSDLPTIEADAQRLRQVLINLLSNALKFSPPESTVSLRALADETALRLEVVDEGPGIPPQDQERIFEKFSRVTTEPDGAGLGLYICRALVAAHRGDIGVTSDGRAGSTFWVRLPRAR